MNISTLTIKSLLPNRRSLISVKTAEFNYHLPKELIAQTPLAVRDESRLLVFERQSGKITHMKFSFIERFLHKGDLLVVNKSRVLPARLIGRKETGGKVEVLLLRKINDTRWEALVGGRHIYKGKIIYFPQQIRAEIIENLEGAKRIIEFENPLDGRLDGIGEIPLPPYIHKQLQNPERYQTVFAKEPGSAAAPTAGLHFTEELIEKLRSSGVEFAEITLHIGLDTFAPITEENVEDHVIHTEWCEIDEKEAEKINQTKISGGRIVAVGTTSVRTLETASYGRLVKPVCKPTNLYIYPGYEFKVVDCMVTNFHLPQSTLIALVSAFMGKENVMRCYEEAVREKYRFYSFGDAMLII